MSYCISVIQHKEKKFIEKSLSRGKFQLTNNIDFAATWKEQAAAGIIRDDALESFSGVTLLRIH